MRVPSLALVVAVAACAGSLGRPERMEDPARTKFAGYRRSIKNGCLYGDCRTGRFARREGGRVYSGIKGEREQLIEWESGRCKGSSYMGGVESSEPHGEGTFSLAQGPIETVKGRWERGQLVGHVDAALRNGGRLTGELQLVKQFCEFAVSDPEAATLDGLPTMTANGAQLASFHGVVAIHGGNIVPWRGRFLVDGNETVGYAVREGEYWSIRESAVCLTAQCSNLTGVELVRGERETSLYAGTFERGLRHGRGMLHELEGQRVLPWNVSYRRGFLEGGMELVRPGYVVECLHRAGADCVVHRGPATMRIQWGDHDTDDAIVRVGPQIGEDFALTVRDVPPDMEPTLAAAASVAPDLERGATLVVSCVTCNKSIDVLPLVHVATEGPRTPLIKVNERRSTEIRELWLADERRWIRGDRLTLLEPEGAPPMLHGTGALVRADGSSTPVVFYDGRRVDPLGYATLEAFQKATPAARAARAQKHAAKAYARRSADAKLVVALREATSGTNEAFTHLATAGAAIIPAEQTTDRHERAIRGAHAAIERAHDALLDAQSGVATALERIADDDPALEPLGALGAHVRDLDERLRVLLVAFEAFEFSEDLDRLSRIATALAGVLDALPAPALQTRLDALRAALAPP